MIFGMVLIILLPNAYASFRANTDWACAFKANPVWNGTSYSNLSKATIISLGGGSVNVSDYEVNISAKADEYSGLIFGKTLPKISPGMALEINVTENNVLTTADKAEYLVGFQRERFPDPINGECVNDCLYAKSPVGANSGEMGVKDNGATTADNYTMVSGNEVTLIVGLNATGSNIGFACVIDKTTLVTNVTCTYSSGAIQQVLYNLSLANREGDTTRLRQAYVYNLSQGCPTGVATDTTLPSVNISLNNTALVGGSVVNVTGNSSDDTGLSFCQIIINQTGTRQYFNFSLSGTSGFCSQNFTMISGAVINFTSRVNDTSNNFAQDSTILAVGDTTTPTLNNCTLQFSTLTDASGNTNTFNCTATDTGGSNIQSMSFDLNGTLNKTISFSITQSQLISSSYIIFKSLETLRVGSYSIRNVSVTDTSSNKLVNSTLFDFSVTSAPSGGGSTPNGGGGGGTTKTIIIKEGIPLLSFGGLNLIGFTVLTTPNKQVKIIRFKNVGNVTFTNAKIGIEGNANKYINPFICNLNMMNCLNEGINIKGGESMFLSLNGTFTEELGDGVSGVIKIQEIKDKGVTHELNLLVTRPPLFSIIKPMSNFRLIEETANILKISPELIALVLVYTVTISSIMGLIVFTTL